MFRCNSAHEHEIASGVKASLEGFVTVHKGSCEQEFQIPRPVAEGLGVLFANARVYVATINPSCRSQSGFGLIILAS